MPRTPLAPGSFGQPSVRRSPNGRGWVARIKIRLLSGRYTEVERTRRLQADAVTAAQHAAQEKIDAGGGYDGRSVTARTLATAALDTYVREKIANPQTQRVYRSAIRLHITPAMENLRVQEVTAPLVERFLQDLPTGTRRTCRAVMSGCWRWLATQGVVATNPVPLTSPIHAEDVQERRTTTPEQTRALLAAARQYPTSPWLYSAMLLYAVTGLRRGEVARIRLADLEVDAEELVPRLRVSRLKKRGRPVTERIVLPDRVYAIVSLQGMRARAQGSPFLFPGRYDPQTHIRGESIETAMKRFIAWARDPERSGDALPSEIRENLPKNLAPRDFRRGAATLLDRAEGLDAAAQLLGHTRSSITALHYVEPMSEIDHSATLTAFAQSVTIFGDAPSTDESEKGEKTGRETNNPRSESL